MIKKIIPHICIVLTLTFLTLFILYQFNPRIVDTDFFTIITYSFCGIALLTSVLASLKRL